MIDSSADQIFTAEGKQLEGRERQLSCPDLGYSIKWPRYSQYHTVFLSLATADVHCYPFDNEMRSIALMSWDPAMISVYK